MALRIMLPIPDSRLDKAYVEILKDFFAALIVAMICLARLILRFESVQQAPPSKVGGSEWSDFQVLLNRGSDLLGRMCCLDS